VLRGTDTETSDRDERGTGFDYSSPWGGFASEPVHVEKVTFYPDQFSFRYKGATISGPLRGVNVETEVLIDGEEADCDQDDIEGAIEKACGFPLDPSEFEEPEMNQRKPQ
jgi:hypothetical protein